MFHMHVRARLPVFPCVSPLVYLCVSVFACACVRLSVCVHVWSLCVATSLCVSVLVYVCVHMCVYVSACFEEQPPGYPCVPPSGPPQICVGVFVSPPLCVCVPLCACVCVSV